MGTFISHLFHLGGAECWGQDAPHSLPAFILQQEQTVRHGLSCKANSLFRDRDRAQSMGTKICCHYIIEICVRVMSKHIIHMGMLWLLSSPFGLRSC